MIKGAVSVRNTGKTHKSSRFVAVEGRIFRNVSTSAAALLKQINVEYILLTIVAFLIGRASFPGGFMPFALPFFTALPAGFAKKAIILVSILAGTLTAGSPEDLMTTAGSILLYEMINHFTSKRNALKANQGGLHVTAIMAFASSVAAGSFPVFAGGFLLYDFLKVVLQGIMVIVLVPVMKNAFLFLKDYKETGVKALGNSERFVAAIIVVISCLSVFSDLGMSGVHMRNVVFVIIILAAGYLTGPGPGAAAGLIAGIMAGIVPEAPSGFIIGTYAFCGLLSGFMCRFGKGGSGLGFILGNTLMSIAFANPVDALIHLAEIMAGITLFLFLPLKVFQDKGKRPCIRKSRSNMTATRGAAELSSRRHMQDEIEAYDIAAADMASYDTARPDTTHLNTATPYTTRPDTAIHDTVFPNPADIDAETRAAATVIRTASIHGVHGVHGAASDTVTFKGMTRETVNQSGFFDKLDNYSRTFIKLSRMFANLSRTGKYARKSELCALFEKINETACAACSLSRHCWDAGLPVTYKAITALIDKMDKYGRIDRSDIPPFFADRCERIKDFITAVNSSYELYKAGMIWKDKESDNWMMISRQFSGFAKLAENMRNECNSGSVRCRGLEEKIMAMLSHLKVKNESVYVWKNMHDKYRVIIKHAGCRSKKRICSQLGNRNISALTGRKMRKVSDSCSGIPGGSSRDKNTQCIMEFIEEEPLKVSVGVCGMAKAADGRDFCYSDVVDKAGELYGSEYEADTEGKVDSVCESDTQGGYEPGRSGAVATRVKSKRSLSGDSCVFFKTADSKSIIALSDGMGTGKNAAIQSGSAIYLLQELIDMGFDLDTSVDMINTMVLCKTGNESYATLDITCIDLYSGDAEFIKMGAAPAYVKTAGGGVDMIKAVSLPAGVMPYIDTELVHKRISNGDIIVMVSDGIIEALGDAGTDGCLELRRLLEITAQDNPQELADYIAKTACETCRVKDGRLSVCDDMTVITARIWGEPVNSL